jgi:hypothetical protein
VGFRHGWAVSHAPICRPRLIGPHCCQPCAGPSNQKCLLPILPGRNGWRLGIELGERLLGPAGSSEVPHGPGLTGTRIRRSPAKAVARAGARGGVRAGDDKTGAVPLLNKRLRDAAGGIL